MANHAEYDAILSKIKALPFSFYLKDYLLTWEQSDANMTALVFVAQALEWLWKNNKSCRVFDSGLAVSNFRDKSTRTRFSFASAASLLGLTLQDMDESKSQVSHGETVRETANMISFLTEVIGIRDDLFIYEGHKYEQEVARAVEEGFREGVLPQRPVVVNLQCDQDHPTQSAADLLHLIETFGSLENLKGKKIAVCWAHSPAYGKPLSVPQSLITLLPRFGMHVTLAHPEGYDLLPEVVNKAKEFSLSGGGSFTQVSSMEEAFTGADVVYPKSWASFQVMEERTAILREGKANPGAMEALEKRCISANSKHQNWECTNKLMELTKDGNALYMHCLPADITGQNCAHGEVSGDAFDKYRLRTYKEAGHKPYAIASAILLGRFKDPVKVLERLGSQDVPHRHE